MDADGLGCPLSRSARSTWATQARRRGAWCEQRVRSPGSAESPRRVSECAGVLTDRRSSCWQKTDRQTALLLPRGHDRFCKPLTQSSRHRSRLPRGGVSMGHPCSPGRYPETRRSCCDCVAGWGCSASHVSLLLLAPSDHRIGVQWGSGPSPPGAERHKASVCRCLALTLQILVT